MKRTLFISVCCTLFCLLFYMIYNLFSHGVHSPFMTFLFAWPLVLCVFPCALFLAAPGGVFDIAGNSSVYQVIMMAAGFVMLFIGLILYAAGIMLLKSHK